MSVLKTVGQLFAVLIRYLCATLLGVMVIVVFGQVIARYLFNSGFSWPEELTRFLCVWITFLGALTATAEDSHPAVDVLVKLLPGVLQKIVGIFLRAVMIVVCIYLTGYGLKLVEMTIRDLSPGLHVPMGLVYLSLPFSMVLMIPYFTVQIVQAAVGLLRRAEKE